MVTDTQGLYRDPRASRRHLHRQLRAVRVPDDRTADDGRTLGLTVDQNISMRPAGVTETVQVVAETPAPIATPVVGVNLEAR